MAIKGRFPTIRPSLDLNFAKTKRLDPRITFTRASAGTYVGSDGLIKTAGINEARFDYSPATLESLGLLVEESRTNLLLRSEEFDNASWSKSATTITANATIAPNGTLSADKLVENTANSTHTLVVFYVPATSGQSYTLSAYFKESERNGVRLRFSSFNGVFSEQNTVFNFTNGSTISNDNISAKIEDVGGGWYRCSATQTALATANAAVAFDIIGPSNASTYQGDGTSGIYIWGAQLEAGAFPTSYIKTEAAAATRSADIASITGTAFSSWYRQDEGTIFTDANVGSGVFPYAYGISDGTSNNRILLYRVSTIATSSTAFDLRVDVGGSNSASFSINAATSRFGFAYKANDFAVSGNGGAVLTDTSGAVAPVNQMTVGGPTFFQCNGTIRRLTYWPQRLSNATLQALTS